jgi:hypothetical protein
MPSSPEAVAYLGIVPGYSSGGCVRIPRTSLLLSQTAIISDGRTKSTRTLIDTRVKKSMREAALIFDSEQGSLGKGMD